ncbi:MAG: amidophosphoribosyltransferase [Syntrophales bacterium]|nr:amidophosphoribosyltransferase [Syntrophales bacterium]
MANNEMIKARDNCGVFGIYSQEPCVYDIFNGLDFLQHRGQEYCGIATYDGRIRQVIHHGKAGNSFTPQDFEYLKGNWGIGHVSLWERQPMSWQSKLGDIAVAFSGNILNAEELIKEMMTQGHAFQGSYHTEILAKIIMESDDILSGITAIAKKVRGAYSMVILTREGVYGVRDVFGFRPFILGKDKKRVVVCSESRAIQNMDMEVVRDVAPGEVVLLNENGINSLMVLPTPRRAHCAFEWAYTASIDSVIEGLYVQKARNNLGGALALRDKVENETNFDLVAPIPMSGIGHALGYHQVSGIPYQEVFLYNRYADRSYTLSSQEAREKMARRKLSVLRYAVAGKRIVLCDDSIVRGTQILSKIRDLKNSGAKEVHVRISCPPLMYPCDFGVSTRTYDELIARKFIPKGNINSIEQLHEVEGCIAREIEADSVKYNSIDSFVNALGIPRENLCLKCWDGIYPTDALE